MLPFSGRFGLSFGAGVRGVMALCRLGGRGFKPDFHRYVKSIIGDGGIFLFFLRLVVYGLARLCACIRKTPRINIRWMWFCALAVPSLTSGGN